MCSNAQGHYGSNNSLSPAAQAVIRAAASVYWEEEYEVAAPSVIAAAALRAAVDQVLPDKPLHMTARGTRHWHRAVRDEQVRREFLAIATELENTDD